LSCILNSFNPHFPRLHWRPAPGHPPVGAERRGGHPEGQVPCRVGVARDANTQKGAPGRSWRRRGLLGDAAEPAEGPHGPRPSKGPSPDDPEGQVEQVEKGGMYSIL